jgi:hypothetical protein
MIHAHPAGADRNGTGARLGRPSESSAATRQWMRVARD